jgi:hypothetical protein
MKPHRTPLRADLTKAPTVSGEASRSGATQSADLRERLTQTRARIARTHSEHTPQIDMDWDPEEQPTRQYSSDKWLMPRPSAAAPRHAHANDYERRQRAISEERLREQPARARARSGAIPVDPARRAAEHEAADAPTSDDAAADARRAARLGSTESAAAWVKQAGMLADPPGTSVQARRSQPIDPSWPGRPERRAQPPAAASAQPAAADAGNVAHARPGEAQPSAASADTFAAARRPTTQAADVSMFAQAQRALVQPTASDVAQARPSEAADANTATAARRRTRTQPTDVGMLAEAQPAPVDASTATSARRRTVTQPTDVGMFAEAHAADAQVFSHPQPPPSAAHRVDTDSRPLGTFFGDAEAQQPLGTFADIARRSVELTPAHGIQPATRSTMVPARGRQAPAAVQTPVAPPKPRAASYLTLLQRELRVLGARIERTDARLRRRIVYSAAALGVIAAISRMLFGTHEGARVLVTTTPADASVSLDGKPVPGADNPHVLDTVAPGEHVLAIEKPGFVTQRHKLTLAAGEHEHPLTLKLTPLLQKVSVSVSSDPAGARIVLDGQDTGRTTPADLSELAPGRHEVTLQLAGYAETKEALVLPQDALLSIKLASLAEPVFAPAQAEARLQPSRAEQRAQARELARERRAAAKAAKVLLRYRARMGLPPDPVAQELVDAYGPAQSAE